MIDDSTNLVKAVADPVQFCKTILGNDPWMRSQDTLRSVATHRRTAVKACHASSKSWTAARAALWWATNFQDGVVICTAPTFTQVEHVLFAELHTALAGSLIKYPDANQVELKLGPNNYILGISTDKGVRFQGWHGKILIVLDEAPGIRPDIYEAIEGIRAGGDVRILAIGNPTIPSGPFYEAFSTNSRGWNTITISAFDTPNLKGITLESLVKHGDDGDEDFLDKNVRPYLTSRRWVWEKYHEWGPTSPLWQSRVLGQFPDQAIGALFPHSWLERARPIPDNEVSKDDDEGVSIGVDVAGPGEDETVCCARRKNRILDTQGWSLPEPRGEVVAFINKYSDDLRRVNVDAVGIGYYMAQHLKDQFGADRVTEVNVSERPKTRGRLGVHGYRGPRRPGSDYTGGLSGEEDFANLKAEIYWAFRHRLWTNSVSGLVHPKTFEQLSGILYRHNPRGQVEIESKDQAVKRGARSPDFAEATILAFARLDHDEPAFAQFVRNRLESMKAAAEAKESVDGVEARP